MSLFLFLMFVLKPDTFDIWGQETLKFFNVWKGTELSKSEIQPLNSGIGNVLQRLFECRAIKKDRIKWQTD